MSRWFGDTLSKRLFILIWVALVGSHLLAYAVVSSLRFGADPPGSNGGAVQGDQRTTTDAARGEATATIDPLAPERPGGPGGSGRRGGPGGPGAPDGPGDRAGLGRPGGDGPGGPGGPPPRGEHAGAPLPTFPSLPPTPGLPGDATGHAPPRPPDRLPGDSGLADRSMRPPPGGDGRPPPGPGPGAARPALPSNMLLLDYGIRLLVIALAAWFGSRWLARPMRDLVAASRSLGDSIGGSVQPTTSLPELNEHRGTLEVREAARVFNTMARQLREQFEARGLMVAAISHDLRTPLTRLRMRLETMDAAPQAQQRCVADIREMNTLIDTVLEVFRGDGMGAGEPLQSTDVQSLVQALTDDLIEQGETVTFVGETALTQVQPSALRRVVGNLISNALRYGKRADVQVLRAKDGIRILVDDDGPGISPAYLEAVFQPFFRVDSSRNPRRGGTGLGLYIARDLAHRQGGRLTLVNRPQGGLRAEVFLPLR